MPFKSKSQARAAFGGYLGPEMKAKAAAWEDETPGGIKSLPMKVKSTGQHPHKNLGGYLHPKKGR